MITTQQVDARLDVTLLEHLHLHLHNKGDQATQITRRQLKQLFEEGKVLLHGVPTKPSRLLSPGQQYEVIILGWNPAKPKSIHAHPSLKGSFIPVVYEDQNLLILHKPTGVPSAPHKSSETETAVGSALAHFPDLIHAEGSPLEPGLIHRLDTGTSGLLLFTKNKEEYLRVKTLWQNREVKKTYRALVDLKNPLRPFPLTLNAPLAHDAKSSTRMIALNNNLKMRSTQYRGTPLKAVTHLLEGIKLNKSLADLTLELETGVMHQIRCHLASQGWPIVGDFVYKGPRSERLWLHAWRLELSLKSGTVLNLEAKLPEGWKQATAKAY